MGGAFVGLADDFTAVFWNPAGLTQLSGKTFGATGDLIVPNGTYTLEYGTLGFPLPGNAVDATTVSKAYPSGLGGYFHPVTDKMVLGLGIYTPAGLGAKWEGKDFVALTGGKSYEWLSFIGVITIAPTVAYQVNDMVSVGASLNINYGFFSISRHAGFATPAPGVQIDLGQYEEDSTGMGFGATLGVLVKPSEQFSLGVTFRTPSKVSMSGDTSISGVGALGFATESDFDRDVTQPMWLAGGVAFKPIENLTLTADLQYTNWDALGNEAGELETEYDDPAWQVFMGSTGGDKIPLDWSDKIQLRFGLEYVFDKFAVRGGYYYDPAPAPDETFTVLMPNFDFNVFCVGVGYMNNGVGFNLGFEYLSGKDRDVAPALDNMPGMHGLNIWTVLAGLSYGF
jgi:long-chain fatty acid transport protein